jgi:3-hydroxyisobutyrate dehydrogenase
MPSKRLEQSVRVQQAHGFAVDWMRKDLAICLNEAQNNGSELPVTQMVDGFYEQVQAHGGNRWDTSSLLRRLPRKDKL